MARLGPILAALLVAPAVGQAATVTITFDELGDFDYQPTGGKVGNVRYEDQNRYRYDHIAPYLVLGDDGFSAGTVFVADPGTAFTPVSIDLRGYNNTIRAPCPGCDEKEREQLADLCVRAETCPGGEPYDFGYLLLTGYRDGVAVAVAELGAGLAEYDDTYVFGDEFTQLSALRVRLLLQPVGGLPADGYAYQCGEYFFIGCIGGRVDDFTVVTDVAPAPVPLPGGLPLYAAALGAGALALRRQRR
ncbi:hypothetical protein [Rubellimicrobium aerolatum]|uniref:VPLPA-CTERM sorting domain-containing protein n=1 Tax=Rubellimicrobium aerolatum TaxID=490979 RepID=A0ABW0S7D8_9RHOB|nr:hypothetical protein [Rubellimicrobium aerolatum]MBP1804594.1 hypothetical protein [Rubellimicrobium aerolatum]